MAFSQDSAWRSFKPSNKVVSATHALSFLKDDDTVIIGGFIGMGHPEYLMIELEKLFLRTQHPRNLCGLWCGGPGDNKEKGINHIAHEGLLGSCIAGHFGLIPKVQQLIVNNKMKAHNIPIGVLVKMLRDIGAGMPFTISPVGLGTYMDPRFSGGKLNSVTTEDIVELVTIGGRDMLAYKTKPINVALLRGTSADPEGNISVEHEALPGESLAAAIATKNSGGIVIVQVERIAAYDQIPRSLVRIPGELVTYVVQAPPELHWQTFVVPYSPAYSGEMRVPEESVPPLEMGPRKIIARRAILELQPKAIVNLGIGMPESVAAVANEERVIKQVSLTTELGVFGGIQATGLNFGASVNATSVIDPGQQFDFYEGGGLDVAFLGLAQADSHGNVNVSMFNKRISGAGGFPNITHGAKKLVFLGTFTALGLELKAENGTLTILKEGTEKKFVSEVEHVTFSGPSSIKYHPQRPVMFITERCVFRLCEEGLELCEIAPGVNIEKEILSLMDFKPKISPQLKEMDKRIFRLEKMGLLDS